MHEGISHATEPRSDREGSMSPPCVSECGRFVVIKELHLDRKVFDALARWAEERGIGIQDAVQIALCSFNDSADERASTSAFRVHDRCLNLASYRRAPETVGPAPDPPSLRSAAHESERTPLPFPEP